MLYIISQRHVSGMKRERLIPWLRHLRSINSQGILKEIQNTELQMLAPASISELALVS